MRLCRASMLLFSVILFCSLRVLPQTAVTSLHGTVVDPGGAVTPQADINLTRRGIQLPADSAGPIYSQDNCVRFCAAGQAN